MFYQPTTHNKMTYKNIFDGQIVDVAGQCTRLIYPEV